MESWGAFLLESPVNILVVCRMSLMSSYRTSASSLATMKGGVFCAGAFFVLMTFLYWNKASVGYGNPHVLMISKRNDITGAVNKGI